MNESGGNAAHGCGDRSRMFGKSAYKRFAKRECGKFVCKRSRAAIAKLRKVINVRREA